MCFLVYDAMLTKFWISCNFFIAAICNPVDSFSSDGQLDIGSLAILVHHGVQACNFATALLPFFGEISYLENFKRRA